MTCIAYNKKLNVILNINILSGSSNGEIKQDS